MSSMGFVPKFSAFKSDETAISGLRLMRCFFRLSKTRREELIVAAERMLEEDLIQSKCAESEKNTAAQNSGPKNSGTRSPGE